MVPLVYASIISHDTLFTLLGITATMPDLKANLVSLAKDMFGFGVSTGGYYIRPAYSLGIMMIALIGLVSLFTNKHTARSYVVLTWGALLTVIVILNPHMVSYLFPLVALLISFGMLTLITSWYKLFPHNPYARIAGMIPLGIIVVGVMTSGVSRYINNYQYNPNLLAHYSKDLTLLQRELARDHTSADAPAIVVVEQTTKPFYTLAAHYDNRFTIAASLPTNTTHTVILDRATHMHTSSSFPTPLSIITDSRAQDSDRFYLYKFTQK